MIFSEIRHSITTGKGMGLPNYLVSNNNKRKSNAHRLIGGKRTGNKFGHDVSGEFDFRLVQELFLLRKFPSGKVISLV